MLIKKAEIDDHASLTDLTIASKSYWDYSQEQIEEWLPDLTITQSYIESNEVFKLLIDDEIAAYYSYYSTGDREVLLDNMFVSPKFIGNGLGRELFVDFEERAKLQGVSKVIVFADPNSQGFYARFGFNVIGQEETSIANRFLPIMQKEL